MIRPLFTIAWSLFVLAPAFGQKKATTPPPTAPPLVSADPALLPEGCDHLDLYLLIGQSNMKGRGFMPEIAKNDPTVLSMHLRNDQWYRARHPLHLTGDPESFKGHDNAGVGPGLAFAEVMREANPSAAVGLIPSAKGGSEIKLWSETGPLYLEAIRRTKLALSQGPQGKTKLRGVLWLQGEADARPGKVEIYAEKLNSLVDRLRADLGDPELPFVACTIGEMRPDSPENPKAAINAILLDLPKQRPGTACVDARDLKSSIGDSVHFDTASQEEIGRRYAAELKKLRSGPSPSPAVAIVMKAHTLLRTMPGVDPDKTAVTGISWGGYTTCLAADANTWIVTVTDDRGAMVSSEVGMR